MIRRAQTDGNIHSTDGSLRRRKRKKWENGRERQQGNRHRNGKEQTHGVRKEKDAAAHPRQVKVGGAECERALKCDGVAVD